MARAAVGVHQQLARLPDDGHGHGCPPCDMPRAGWPDQDDAKVNPAVQDGGTLKPDFC